MIKLDNSLLSHIVIKDKLNHLSYTILKYILKDTQAKIYELNKNTNFAFDTLKYFWSIETNLLLPDWNNWLILLSDIFHAVSKEIFSRHTKKWLNLTGNPYPVILDQYLIQIVPSRFFQCSLAFSNILATKITTKIVQNTIHTLEFLPLTKINHNNRVTIQDGIVLPKSSIDILSKGPKHTVCHTLDKNFLPSIEANLHECKINLRRSNTFQHTNTDNLTNSDITSNITELKIPFDRRTIFYPQTMDPSREMDMKLLSQDIFNIYSKENKNTKNSKSYKVTRSILKDTKEHIIDKKLAIVPSDKTNRIVVTYKDAYEAQTQKLLLETDKYKKLDNSRIDKIEKQANRLISSMTRKMNIPKRSKEKLNSKGCSAASFYTLIKDHKNCDTQGQFPLRPIASVNNTPTEKVDWLLSAILKQLLVFIPSHIVNVDVIINKLLGLQVSNISNNLQFISLDVVALYPSIPLVDAISHVMVTLEQHESDIDTFGLSISDIRDLLTFVCFNYEIVFNDQHYLQLSGVPMGAHFSPIVAIIFMDFIEISALEILTNKGILPIMYHRYIDDILFGPIEHNTSIHMEILNTFNSIHSSIQFTLENPEPTEFLPFLDLEIRIKMQSTDFCWYKKPFHSGNTMTHDAMQPYHVKRNILINTFRCINTHSSSIDNYINRVSTAKTNFLNAGFSISEIAAAELLALTSGCKPRPNSSSVNKKSFDNNSVLKLPFLNTHTNNQINKIVAASNLPIRVVYIPGPSISSIFRPRCQNVNTCLCDICGNFDKISCKWTNLVYQFSCIHCHLTYIGKTTRTLAERFSEHSSSIKKLDKKSALAEHLQTFHVDKDHNIFQFSLSILKKCRSPTQTAIFESMLIQQLHPEINRKHEMFLII